MSSAILQGGASGTGSVTLLAPNTNSNQTQTLPDATGQIMVADGSGNLSVTGNLSFNSGYGSSAVAYGCRAWVNFNGTGTVAIRASGNVSSITDNGTGDYTVNFSNAMPDANYNFVGMTEANATFPTTVAAVQKDYTVSPTTSALRIRTCVAAGSFAFTDSAYTNIAIFR